MIKIILATDRGNAIGWKDGRLPWKLPHDMRRFKELTTGGTVVMGRTTFQSLGRPAGLPNRKNYVLTKRQYSEVRDQLSEVDIISSLDFCLPWSGVTGDDLWIIGGASVYAEALDKCMVDEIYLTLVHSTSGADVTLKHDLVAWKLWIMHEFNEHRYWVLTEHEHTPANGDVPGTTYVTLKRIRNE